MLSYWERQSFLQYDYIIAGGGIVGLSTAISLREKYPHKKILLLERGLFPSGASTKNAGFACIGSFTELLDYLQTMAEEEVLQLVALRIEGLKLLRKRLGDNNIDYRENGSYELINENELRQLNQLNQLNQLLYPLLGGNAYKLMNEKITTFGFNTDYTKALIQNCYEGELNTGKMMRALTDLVIASHIEIKTGAQVMRWEESPDNIKVIIEDSFLKEEIIFVASQLIICNNAFAKTLLPEADIQPGRGQIILTTPINDLSFKGIFHFDKGYYYFRELQGRILFGGGRNLDFWGEATTQVGLSKIIQDNLEKKLHEIILPNHSFEIDQRWSGIMAFGKSHMPLVKKYSSRIVIGVRMSGMGIAIGSKIGEQLASLISDV